VGFRGWRFGFGVQEVLEAHLLLRHAHDERERGWGGGRKEIGSARARERERPAHGPHA
jgi:hypothetical protein